MTMSEKNEKPLKGLRFAADFQIQAAEGDSSITPVRLVANSGRPFQYGDLVLVLDFDTMTVKEKIPLDYCHSWQEAIGYLNKFAVEDELVCSGSIVPYPNSPWDRGAEVVAKMRGGVPYQASVEIHQYSLELVLEGVTTTVNGNEITGPCYVVRDWTLAAVAICKFGADSETSSELAIAASKLSAADSRILVRDGVIMSKKDEVKPEIKATETPAVEQKQEAPVPAPAKVEEKPAEEQPVAAAKDEAKPLDPREEYRKFAATFGDKAGDYFTKGLSFEAAQSEHLVHLTKQNAELTKKLSAVDRGAAEPVSFTDESKGNKSSKPGLQSVMNVPTTKGK